MRLNSAWPDLRRRPPLPRGSLLDFLLGLPEKQVRADGGAEHRHDRHDVVRVHGERGTQQPAHHLRPGDFHDEHANDVAEQRQAQPLKSEA